MRIKHRLKAVATSQTKKSGRGRNDRKGEQIENKDKTWPILSSPILK